MKFFSDPKLGRDPMVGIYRVQRNDRLGQKSASTYLPIVHVDQNSPLLKCCRGEHIIMMGFKSNSVWTCIVEAGDIFEKVNTYYYNNIVPRHCAILPFPPTRPSANSRRRPFWGFPPDKAYRNANASTLYYTITFPANFLR